MKILVKIDISTSLVSDKKCDVGCPYLVLRGENVSYCTLFGPVARLNRHRECIKAAKDLEDYEELKWRMQQLEK